MRFNSIVMFFLIICISFAARAEIIGCHSTTNQSTMLTLNTFKLSGEMKINGENFNLVCIETNEGSSWKCRTLGTTIAVHISIENKIFQAYFYNFKGNFPHEPLACRFVGEAD